MSDGDVFTRGLRPKWRRAGRLLKENARLEEVAGAIQWAGAQDIRESNGVHELPIFTSIVDAVYRGQLSVIDAIKQTRVVVHDAGDRRNTRIAGRATERLIIEIAEGDRPVESTAHLVSRAFVRELIDCEFFGRANAPLVGQRFSSIGEAMAAQDRVMRILEPHISRMAESLTKLPTGERVQAQRNPRTPQRSTADLLYVPVEL